MPANLGVKKGNPPPVILTILDVLDPLFGQGISRRIEVKP
jgi:hypothetical protein